MTQPWRLSLHPMQAMPASAVRPTAAAWIASVAAKAALTAPAVASWLLMRSQAAGMAQKKILQAHAWGLFRCSVHLQELARKMEALLERLDSMGLPHVAGTVLSSVPASGSIHDQVLNLERLLHPRQGHASPNSVHQAAASAMLSCPVCIASISTNKFSCMSQQHPLCAKSVILHCTGCWHCCIQSMRGLRSHTRASAPNKRTGG